MTHWFLFWLLTAFPEGILSVQPVPAQAVVDLPKSVDGWTRQKGPRRFTPKTIFDYMDGAGELYIGYRLRYLIVFEYVAAGEDQILVEVYQMQTSDDAFGLLSGDWSGEPVDLGQGISAANAAVFWPGERAIYTSGLLRIWSGGLYARILAYRETTKSRAVVLNLGRLIMSLGEKPAPPKILSALPSSAGDGLQLRRDRVCYFRSHMVLNSMYLLGSANVLNLDRSTEAVTASYAPSDGGEPRRPPRIILARYRDSGDAVRARSHFEKVYLPGKKIEPAAVSKSGDRRYFKVEEGWLGYGLAGRTLALAFECPSRESTARLIEEALSNPDIAGPVPPVHF